MKQLNRNNIIFFIGAAILVCILLFFHFKGAIDYDEGYILNSALRAAHGQMPYKDFDTVYTPLSYLITAASLKVFGESIFAGRLAAFFISCLSLFGIYKLLTLIIKRKLVIFLSLLMFAAWGPAHINFPWPTMFAVCLYIYTLLFFIYGIVGKGKKFFYLAGICAVLTFFAKQNFGTGALLIPFISFLFIKIEDKKNFIISYIAGVVTTAFIAFILLLATSSFSAFIQDMYVYTIQKIIVEKTLSTPFLYSGPIVIRVIKLFFYLIPLIISLIAMIVTYKKRRNWIVIGIFTGMFYLLGIRPTTDYDHLVSLLAVSALAFAVSIEYVNKLYFQRALLVITILLIGLGLYTAYFSGYYKWETPLRYNTYYDSSPRVGVYLTQEKAKNLALLSQYIDKHTKPDDYIFVNYYSPLIYFLADRKNATQFDYLNIPLEYQNQIIKNLKEKDVNVAVMSTMNENEQSIIADYIRRNYHISMSIGNYIVYSSNTSDAFQRVK